MNSKNTCLLKTQVEKIFGRRILSSSDCQSLCNEIFRVSKVKISFNTARRLFNLLKADNKPSLYTLNALANYCGFSSFDEFIIAKSRNVIIEPENHDNVLLSFLTLFFKQIQVFKKNDVTYLSLVENTILHLELHPPIIDRFQRDIAHTENGQNFYFEQFVYVDKLNSYYGKGLHYYLHEKKAPEAQIFAYSLLSYNSWLIQDNEEFVRCYNKVMQYKIDRNTSYSVAARYFATRLFYTNIFNLPQEEIILEAKKFYLSGLGANENAVSLNCFELILSETLILTGKYEEAQFYIDEVRKKTTKTPASSLDKGVIEVINLFKAITLAYSGKKTEARQILNNVKTADFYFLSKQYMYIFYLSLQQLLKNKKDDQEQVHHLIAQTGFTRLSFILQNTIAVAA